MRARPPRTQVQEKRVRIFSGHRDFLLRACSLHSLAHPYTHPHTHARSRCRFVQGFSLRPDTCPTEVPTRCACSLPNEHSCHQAWHRYAHISPYSPRSPPSSTTPPSTRQPCPDPEACKEATTTTTASMNSPTIAATAPANAMRECPKSLSRRPGPTVWCRGMFVGIYVRLCMSGRS